MILLLVGPDGAGKSSVAGLLAEALPQARFEHFRVFASSTRDINTTPHSQPPRGLLASVAKILFLWLEQLLAVPVHMSHRRGPIVVERGWWDQCVDSRRYRMDPRAIPLVRILGRLLPKADVAVLLTASGHTVNARKPELSVAEIDRQLRVWAEILPIAAKYTRIINTESTSPEQSCAQVLALLS